MKFLPCLITLPYLQLQYLHIRHFKTPPVLVELKGKSPTVLDSLQT